MAPICGMMVVNTLVSGSQTICKALASMSIPMIDDMMASTTWTRERVMVSTNGLMDVHMKVGGTKESSMGLEHTITKDRSSMDFGRTENVLSGSKNKKSSILTQMDMISQLNSRIQQAIMPLELSAHFKNLLNLTRK